MQSITKNLKHANDGIGSFVCSHGCSTPDDMHGFNLSSVKASVRVGMMVNVGQTNTGRLNNEV
jgi:hypothetical protein